MTFEAWWQQAHEFNVSERDYGRLKQMAWEAWRARDQVDSDDTRRLEWLSHRDGIGAVVGRNVVQHSVHDLRREIDKAMGAE